jgi:hypothetical protein
MSPTLLNSYPLYYNRKSDLTHLNLLTWTDKWTHANTSKPSNVKWQIDSGCLRLPTRDFFDRFFYPSDAPSAANFLLSLSLPRPSSLVSALPIPGVEDASSLSRRSPSAPHHRRYCCNGYTLPRSAIPFAPHPTHTLNRGAPSLIDHISQGLL